MGGQRSPPAGAAAANRASKVEDRRHTLTRYRRDGQVTKVVINV
jgi:hypothetical protein